MLEASVARVRKGIFDEGFVIVTKVAKKATKGAKKTVKKAKKR